MTPPGIEPQPVGTMVDRALALLETGPVESLQLAHDVLCVPAATPPIADRLATALLGTDPRVRRRTDHRWELVRHRAVAPRLEECVFAVVDVETTGSSPGRGDRVIEGAVAVLAGGVVEMVVDTLVDPERPIPAPVTGLTRITPADVRAAPRFADVADEFVAALAGRVFVAHNVQFDWAFVSGEVRRALDVRLDGPRLCTVKLARRLLPGLRSRSLDSVARYFGIEIEPRHRAGPDAYATARILARLLERAADRDVTTLGELQELIRPRLRKRRRRRARPTSTDEA